MVIVSIRFNCQTNRLGYLVSDFDDDGETAAGSRLLKLLELCHCENVVVVVTRWFGGIQLGPDRFKHINNVARALLDKHGFIKKK
jgi:putative IMPACT (imprinted ancient) family translation regulator